MDFTVDFNKLMAQDQCRWWKVTTPTTAVACLSHPRRISTARSLARSLTKTEQKQDGQAQEEGQQQEGSKEPCWQEQSWQEVEGQR